jgi:hypothetical protein
VASIKKSIKLFFFFFDFMKKKTFGLEGPYITFRLCVPDFDLLENV